MSLSLFLIISVDPWRMALSLSLFLVICVDPWRMALSLGLFLVIRDVCEPEGAVRSKLEGERPLSRIWSGGAVMGKTM